MVLIEQILTIVRNTIFLSVGLIMVSIATLEFIFCPMLLFRYYIPSLIYRHGLFTNDVLITFFYLLFILIELLNILASVVLFLSIFLSGYHDQYLSYDTFMLISISISLSIITHRFQTDYDVYEDVVIKDYYLQIAKVGDWICTPTSSVKDFNFGSIKKKTGLKCHYSDVYHWHQMNECCGWTSAEDLIGIIENKDKNQWKTNQTDERLPKYCCRNNDNPWPLRLMLHNQSFVNGTSIHNFNTKRQQYCWLNSTNVYKQTCRYNKQSMLSLRSITIIGHPVHFGYISLKLFHTLSYTFAKQHLLPQSEGAFSFYLQP